VFPAHGICTSFFRHRYLRSLGFGTDTSSNCRHISPKPVRRTLLPACRLGTSASYRSLAVSAERNRVVSHPLPTLACAGNPCHNAGVGWPTSAERGQRRRRFWQPSDRKSFWGTSPTTGLVLLLNDASRSGAEAIPSALKELRNCPDTRERARQCAACQGSRTGSKQWVEFRFT
jgi:hypothetical protein